MSNRTTPVTYHRTAAVEGLEIFYREAGEPGAPLVLLLHGFPSSSHMYRHLVPALADRYHVIAPDLPGFGLSSMPPREEFAYGFGRFVDIIEAFLEKLAVTRYALYVMDYGAPVGFRLALKHPDRVTALIIQNGNAYEDGMQEFWSATKALWADNSQARRNAIRPFMSLEGTRSQYIDGVSDISRLDPAAWLHDQYFLDRPGNVDIQLDIIYDYRWNVELYPQFHAYFRKHQPPTLISWGRNDRIFAVEGARAFLRDLPRAELHLIDSGHFALEDKADEIVPLVRGFLDRVLS